MWFKWPNTVWQLYENAKSGQHVLTSYSAVSVCVMLLVSPVDGVYSKCNMFRFDCIPLEQYNKMF